MAKTAAQKTWTPENLWALVHGRQPTPAEKTWLVPNANGQTGQQALLAQWTAQQPAAPADPGPPQPDAQANADIAQREFDVAQGHANNAQAQAYDQQDLDEALRRMALQHPVDIQNTKQSANRQGLLFSGHLGQNLGNLETSYQRSVADNQQAFGRRTAARTAADAALDQGLPLEQAAAIAGSADRKVQNDQTLAGENALAPNPVAPATTPAAPKAPVLGSTGYNARRGQSYAVIRRKGQLFHQYAGGRAVRVG